jgi:hypothetical protein
VVFSTFILSIFQSASLIARLIPVSQPSTRPFLATVKIYSNNPAPSVRCPVHLFKPRVNSSWQQAYTKSLRHDKHRATPSRAPCLIKIRTPNVLESKMPRRRTQMAMI